MNVRKELEKHGCIYTGHFVGVSGKHLAGYCNIDPILPHTTILNKITKLLVEPFAGHDIDTVVAPAVGAIPLTQWGPYHLEKMTKKTVLGVWADKAEPKTFKFERSGFLEAVKGKKVLILEDIINQMFSIKEMVKIVKETGGIVVGAGSIVANRGVSAEAIGVPKLITLADVHYDVWTPQDCQKQGLCSKKVPIIIDVGHGDEFQKLNPNYDGGYTKLLD
jgi:orotate phosphoribosyltransferase